MAAPTPDPPSENESARWATSAETSTSTNLHAHPYYSNRAVDPGLALSLARAGRTRPGVAVIRNGTLRSRERPSAETTVRAWLRVKPSWARECPAALDFSRALG